MKILEQLKIKKENGLDHISERLLKDSATVISKRLTNLFNRSLESGDYPRIGKCGKVVALFKSGCRIYYNNNRPITILPLIRKILKRAV